MRFPTLPSTAIAAALMLTACSRGPDPAQIERERRIERENAQIRQQLRDSGAANAALQEQLAQIQSELAASHSAAAAPAFAAPVAATVPPAPTPIDAQPASSGEPAAPASAPPKAEKEPVATLKPSGADESETLQPGWIVEVFPMKFESNSDNRRSDNENNAEWRNFQPAESFSLGSFVNAPSPIRLLAHRKYTKGQNHVQYVASAYFTVQNRGDHVFVLTLADKSREQRPRVSAVCALKLTLEDQDIINDYIRVAPGRELSTTGGSNLIEGLYKTGLTISCPYVGPWIQNPDLSGLEEIALTIAVRRPGEPSPVELSERDLVYVAKK
jgi:hypothetical protein